MVAAIGRRDRSTARTPARLGYSIGVILVLVLPQRPVTVQAR